MNDTLINTLFSLDALLDTFYVYKKGKSDKVDVLIFEHNLAENIDSLHKDIIEGVYTHGPYTYFEVFDTKKRDIYKASVRDRIVHYIIYKYLNSIFDKSFLLSSFSSRVGFGSKKATETLKYFLRLSDEKDTILKFDIKKYFDSIDHKILLSQIKKKVEDEKMIIIIEQIVRSFGLKGKGIPLGNVTSQIFANIYLNDFDHFVKDVLRTRFYVRYNDDFVLITRKQETKLTIKEVDRFISDLKLVLPKEKILISKLEQGVMFLGFKIFKTHCLLRKQTKQKVYKNFEISTVFSYTGLLTQCNSFNLTQKLLSTI